MVSPFSPPPSLTCILCRATISIRKGDKARFFSHISHDHEVHYDMDLLYALSYMTDNEKETVIKIMDKRLTATEEDHTKTETEIETISLDESVVPDTSAEHEEIVAPATDISVTEKVEKKPSRLKCPKCELMLSRKTLKVHMKLKHKSRQVQGGQSSCKFCDKMMRRDSLARHLRRVHGSTKQEHDSLARREAAPEAATEFSTKIKTEVLNEVVEGHETAENKVKSNEKKRFCKICFKSVRISSYPRHLKEKHSGIVNRCKLCQIRIVRKENIKKHLETCHKEDRHLLDDQLNPTFSKADCKYECSECQVKFITQSVLECHVAKSHGTGKEQCEQCLRRFRHSWSLKKHRDTCHVLSVSMP